MADANPLRPICRKIRGDELSALSGKAGIQESLLALWGKAEVISCNLHNHFFVIFSNEEKEEILAIAKLVEVVTGKEKLIGVIHDVATREEYQGRGLGTALMNKIIRFGKEHGFDYLELTSNPTREPANKLYQRVKFTLVAKAAGEKGTNLYRFFYS